MFVSRVKNHSLDSLRVMSRRIKKICIVASGRRGGKEGPAEEGRKRKGEERRRARSFQESGEGMGSGRGWGMETKMGLPPEE